METSEWIGYKLYIHKFPMNEQGEYTHLQLTHIYKYIYSLEYGPITKAYNRWKLYI